MHVSTAENTLKERGDGHQLGCVWVAADKGGRRGLRAGRSATRAPRHGSHARRNTPKLSNAKKSRRVVLWYRSRPVARARESCPRSMHGRDYVSIVRHPDQRTGVFLGAVRPPTRTRLRTKLQTERTFSKIERKYLKEEKAPPDRRSSRGGAHNSTLPTVIRVHRTPCSFAWVCAGRGGMLVPCPRGRCQFLRGPTRVCFVFKERTHHDSWVLGAPYDGREHRARRVVTGKAGLAHAGPVVDHQGLYILFRHGKKERVTSKVSLENGV